MSDCDQFDEGSRRYDICTGRADLPEQKINAYRKAWGLAPLTEFPAIERKDVVHEGTQRKHRRRTRERATSCSCVTPKRTRFGPGAELIRIMKRAGVPSCQACKDLAKQMNAWGPEKCRDNVALIVDDMLPRAKQWVEQKSPWIPDLMPQVVSSISEQWHLPTFAVRIGVSIGNVVGVPDSVLRMALQSLVSQAIDEYEANPEEQVVHIASTRNRKKYPTRSRPIKLQLATFPESAPPIVRIIPVIRTSRREIPTIDRTIASLADAGFERPMVYSEPNTDPNQYEVKRFDRQLQPFLSFVTTCEDLLAKFPDEWFLICEDDVEFQTGAADRLRELPMATDMAFTLYMSQNQATAANADGFIAITGDAHGSLAYLIHSEGVRRIMASEVRHTWDGKSRVDRFVAAACEHVGVELVSRLPSLCQHIGQTSTINKARKLDRSRLSHFEPDLQPRPLLTLITPTGDRPEAFALCEEWIRKQRYCGKYEWIVVDDGQQPTECTMGQHYIRRQPSEGHTLCANLRAALPHVNGQRLLIIEDDEYYGPDYLSTMMAQLLFADIVGERASKYYFVQERKWIQYPSWHHVALCRIGMTSAVYPELQRAVDDSDHRSVDLRLWSYWTGSRKVWMDRRGDMRLGVGMKGLPGRKCGVKEAPCDAVDDRYGTQLQFMLGDDWKRYWRFGE